MKTINNKIKQLRKKAGFSQDNVYPKNASQVSLIESGKIKNPSEITLRVIAKNLEISFEELIDDTSWSPSQTIDRNIKEYAISTEDLKYELGKDSILRFTYRSYPRYDEQGNENNFCPQSGHKLIVSCFKCKRSIDRIDSPYCIGCGNKVLPGEFFEQGYDGSRKRFGEELLTDLPNLYWIDLQANLQAQKQYEDQLTTAWDDVRIAIIGDEEMDPKRFQEGRPINVNDLYRRAGKVRSILSELKRYELEIIERNGTKTLGKILVDDVPSDLIDEVIAIWSDIGKEPGIKDEMLRLKSIIEKIVSYGLSKDDNQMKKILANLVDHSTKAKEASDVLEDEKTKASSGKTSKKDKEV